MPEKEDGTSDSSTDKETKDQDTQDKGKPDDEDAVETNVPWNKDKRFQEFLAKHKNLKQYEQYGSPEEIGGLIQYVQALEARIERLDEKRDDGEKKSPEQKDLEAKRAEARKQLREIDPDLDKIGSLEQALGAQYRSLEVRAMDETTKILGEAGLGTTKAEVAGMANILADIIGSDEVLHAEYVGNPREAVRQAFKRLTKLAGTVSERASKAALQKDKEGLKKLPKTHGPGGGGGEGTSDKEPRTLREAEARAMRRMESLREQ